MKISNLVSGQNKKGNFNKDLFLFDRENIEVGIFNEDKEKNQGLIYLGNESTDNKLIEHIIMLQEDGKNNPLIAYTYNIIQTSYNSETQVTISRQALTVQGFNWLLKRNDVLSTIKDESNIMKYYQSQLDAIGVKDKDNKLLTYQDFLTLAEVSPSGWFNLEFEDDKNKVKIVFNQDGYLYKIEKSFVETKQQLRSLISDDLAPSSEDIVLNEEEQKQAKEQEKLKSFLD